MKSCKVGRQLLLIERGVNVRANVHAVHRNKEIWGDDAELFNPERWFSMFSTNIDYIMQIQSSHLGASTSDGIPRLRSRAADLHRHAIRIYGDEADDVSPAEAVQTRGNVSNQGDHIPYFF